MAKRRTKAQTIVAALQTWSHADSQLAGLPDPLAESGQSDEVTKLLEQSFYTALIADREYWAERNANIGIPVVKTDEEIMLELMYPPRSTVSNKPLLQRVLDALLGR